MNYHFGSGPWSPYVAPGDPVSTPDGVTRGGRGREVPTITSDPGRAVRFLAFPSRYTSLTTSTWPITLENARASRERLREHLSPTPLLSHPLLDREMGHGIRVLVKHENFQPTGSFKVRNGLSLVTSLGDGARDRGLIAASRGNHGQGVAYAGRMAGVPVTVCVPRGNNPEKNAAMRALGATVVEEGEDYDAAVDIMIRLAGERGLTVAHSTNDREVIAGAATMSLEISEQADSLDAMVIAVGGGSQAVGALTVMRALRPDVEVYAVQAEGAAAAHDSWHQGRMMTLPSARTFADGLATRNAYELTFPALRAGLAGFITVPDSAIAESIRVLQRTTHSMVEGAGAAGLAGLMSLREQLAGRTVAVVLSGANIDADTLRRVLAYEI